MYQQLGSADAIKAATKVIEDPALTEVACNVLRLNRIVEELPPGPPCPRREYTDSEKRRGVGLYQVVGPIRAYSWYFKNRVPLALIGGVVLAVSLVGLKYIVSKKK